MIAILQWTTLVVCGLVAAARVPAALRGENRVLFFTYALMTVGILLSIDGPYLAVDRVLGGENVTNLLLRFVIFGIVFVFGLRIARGFGADGALRLITGRPGLAFAGAASAALVVVFLLMDTTGSSAGLVGIYHKNATNAALVDYYGAAGRLYPAFICLALLPATVRTARSALPALVRLGAALLAVGTSSLALSVLSPALPESLGYLRFVLNYAAVLSLLAGLVAIRLSKTRAAKALGAR